MSKRTEAADWLRTVLGAGCARKADIIKQGQPLGYAWATIKRALGDLGAVSQKIGKVWFWTLPQPDQVAQVAHQVAQVAQPAQEAGELTLLQPPSYLTEEVLDLWHRYASLLPPEVLRQADDMGLELLLTTYHRWRQAADVIEAIGTTYETDSGQRKMIPEVRIEADAGRRLRGLLADYGMTPAARKAVTSNAKPAASARDFKAGKPTAIPKPKVN